MRRFKYRITVTMPQKRSKVINGQLHMIFREVSKFEYVMPERIN